MENQGENKSILARHRVGRHNSPAYTGDQAPETSTETPYNLAQEVTGKLREIADATGLSIKCIIECHRSMTNMGKTAHVPAGTPRCRDIARHRLAESVLNATQEIPVNRYRKRCMETARSAMGPDATPADEILLAKQISDGRITPSKIQKPADLAAARALADERIRYPPGMWNDLNQCGQEALPSDAMLARIIRSVRKESTATPTMSDTDHLYRMLKENIPDFNSPTTKN